ncbi:MAG: MiaB/RimO family radical SAM methylthiotransferase [Parcubacteria group bacterium]
MRPGYHIITFGCQMNESDSERIAAVFERLGYKSTDKPETAGVVVINACSVRQKAVDKIWGMVGSLKKRSAGQYSVRKSTSQQLNQCNRINAPILVLTGCVLPADRNRFGRKVDLIFKANELKKLEGFLKAKRKVDGPIVQGMGLPIKPKNKTAYVPIMNGCNNFCSYCVVPYVRGRETSRKVQDILRDVKRAVKSGQGDITLLGQNVNSYNPAEQKKCSSNPFKNKFASLLYEINQMKGVDRVSFLTSHPKDMNDEIIKALVLPKMSNYLHLALQSGDDVILKKMNRGYTAADYVGIIKKVRLIRPDMEIGTDILVGFPGETKKQFENTVKLCKKIRFNVVFLAMYSERKGTAAAKMKDDIPIEEKKRRWKELDAVIKNNHPSVRS